MSDDENELQMDFLLDQTVAERHDMMMGFGPLLPTESARSLMERVQQELKIELKQVILFKFCKSQIVVLFSMKKLSTKRSRIEDVREEILRKRRAGKLPGDTTSVLKNWWQQHAKWPYPTVILLVISCCLTVAIISCFSYILLYSFS
ncbi:hypothetical protein ACSBR2_001858 [Camellia fascicularis]